MKQGSSSAAHASPAKDEASPAKDEAASANNKRLPGPSLENWEPKKIWPRIEDAKVLAKLSKQYPLLATANDLNSPVFWFNDKGQPYGVGYIRYGQVVRATEAVEAQGCSDGNWHKVQGGHICSAEGFEIKATPVELEEEYVEPEIVAIEPFIYGKPRKGAPRLARRPKKDEEKLLATGDRKKLEGSDLVSEWLDGAYFVAIDEESTAEGHSYYRTGMGNYLRKEDVKILEQSTMHGELLDEEHRLPVAFVYGEDRELFCRNKKGKLLPCGVAEKHARIFVKGRHKQGRVEFLLDEQGFALRREDVRLAEKIDRPQEIPEEARWMHIDLSEQTLVAYGRYGPALVTLVSSGIEGHEPPTGAFKIQRRYLTKTMSGPDPDHGVYEVAEVPWTMYYEGNYAVHGAYWHDVFGQVRSHGCTNVPCADARWLFRWVEPDMPRGWHVIFYQDESWVYNTE